MTKQIAKNLLEIEAVFLSPEKPFTWASGLHSPIYCDNRITMSYPDVRRTIAKELAFIIQQSFPGAEVIAGTATAGIPHAAWVAELLNLPMVYIRSKPKDHGKGNQIEGRIQPGQKMVVIEDLISTGGSVLEACAAAEKEGAKVLGVAAIFTYELPKGLQNFRDAGLPCVTTTTYTELLDVAVSTGYINSDQHATLLEWKKDPKAWSNQHKI